MVVVLGFLFVTSKAHVPLLFVLVCRCLLPSCDLTHLQQSFLQFTISAFFTPAKVSWQLYCYYLESETQSALIPSFVPEKQVIFANSLDSLVRPPVSPPLLAPDITPETPLSYSSKS